MIKTHSIFPRGRILLSYVFLAVSLITLFSHASDAWGQCNQPNRNSGDAEKKWGIKILSLRPTAAGHLLDLRFRVVDPPKASDLLNSEKKAYLVDQASGKTLPVPVTRLGPMRQMTLKPVTDRVYFILFSNGQGVVREGDKVTLVIGDLKIENITVEGGGRPEKRNQGPSALSEKKRKRWESAQNVARHEYEVCIEHCGGDANCLDKCKRAFESRLDREYQRLLYE